PHPGDAPGTHYRRVARPHNSGADHAVCRLRNHSDYNRGATFMIQRLLPFLTLIALFVTLSIAYPNFLTATNLSSVVRQTAVINIMALGMTLIIISGGIDLSVGSILAMGGLLGTMSMERHGIPLGMVVGVATGMLCGLFNGTLTTSLRINPFIVTLG